MPMPFKPNVVAILKTLPEYMEEVKRELGGNEKAAAQLLAFVAFPGWLNLELKTRYNIERARQLWKKLSPEYAEAVSNA